MAKDRTAPGGPRIVRHLGRLAVLAAIASVLAIAPASAADGGPRGTLDDIQSGSANTGTGAPSPSDTDDTVDDSMQGSIGPTGNVDAAVYKMSRTPGAALPHTLEAVNSPYSVGIRTAGSEDGALFVALLTVSGSDAPTEYRFDAAIPDHHTAVLQADGSVSLTDADGNAVGGWSKPWAFDANGTAVSTSFKIDGTTLIQTIDHRGAAYPVVADPCGWSWRGALDCAKIAVAAAGAAVVCSSGIGTAGCVVAIASAVILTIEVETSPASTERRCRRNPRAPTSCG